MLAKSEYLFTLFGVSSNDLLPNKCFVQLIALFTGVCIHIYAQNITCTLPKCALDKQNVTFYTV